MSRASFFYAHGTSWLVKLMNPFVNSTLLSVNVSPNFEIDLRFGDSVQSGGVKSTIAGLNGKTYEWNLNPTMDPFPSMLDEELWDERVMINYPAAIVGGGASIDYGRDIMIDKISKLPSGKKFAIGGFSQGAAVASSVYLSGLKPGTTGPLQFKQADFLGAVNFGNPRRQVNHRGAGGQFGTFSGSWYDPDADLGAGGCFPDSGPYARLTNCEDKWVEFVAPSEPITGNGTTLIETKWQALSGFFLGSIDIPSFLAQIDNDIAGALQIAQQLVFGGDGFGRVLKNFFVDAAGQLRDVGGGGHTHYAIYPPPDASGNIATTSQQVNGVTYYTPVGDTMYQLALKFLNGLARDTQAAPIVVPPTTTAGWSTTLVPPAA